MIPTKHVIFIDKMIDSGYSLACVDMRNICLFLESNEYLVDTLIAASPHLKRIFPKDTKFTIELYTDNEADYKMLHVCVSNARTSDTDLFDLMTKFDTDWWLDNRPDDNLLFIPS